jgi:hypothetical protein
MFLVNLFDDGSFSVGYEAGDRVPLSRDRAFYDLHGCHVETVPEGTMVTVGSRADREYCGGWTLASYYVDFPSGRRERLWAWELGTGDVDPGTMKGEPTLYLVPWHEGALWKCAKVVAWSPEDATDRWVKYIAEQYGEDRLDGVTLDIPYTEAKGDECWVGWLR